MAFSARTMRPADWTMLRHFAPHEFNHPDAMGYEFLRWLDDLRDRLGQSLTVSSDHRPPERNAAAGGAATSAHLDTPCNAVDLSAHGMTSAKRFAIVRLAMEMGCRRIGIYANGSVHLDRGEDGRAADVLWVKV